LLILAVSSVPEYTILELNHNQKASDCNCSQIHDHVWQSS